MASKKNQVNNEFKNIPEKIDDTLFFGLDLDAGQKKLANAVWKRDKKIYLVDSMAGTGKTLIATALGVLMVKYGIFKRVVYITFPGIYEKTQGFLPGDLLEKSEPYFQPLYDALIKINELPDHVCNTSDVASQNGAAFIECTVSTYMRGINLNDSFVIIDEAENADLHTLAKVISRISDDSLAMIIGHAGQCDMYDKTQSGFTACIDYQTKYHSDIAASFKLTENHRGKISQYADLMLQEYQPVKYGFIYMVYNIKNNEYYIGKHVRTGNKEDVNDVWDIGMQDKLVTKDILSFGIDNFKRLILCECDSLVELDYMYRLFSNCCIACEEKSINFKAILDNSGVTLPLSQKQIKDFLSCITKEFNIKGV